MKKMAIILTVIAVTATVMLAWRAQNPEQQNHWPPLVFHEVSPFPLSDVKFCLLKGNGSSAFSAFEKVGTLRPRGHRDRFNDVLLDRNRSRLFVGLNKLNTVVSLRSEKPPTNQQLDLLKWCTSRPSERWNPKHLRDK